MRIITDKDVSNDITAFLRSREHEGILSREILPEDTPDPVIAEAATEQRAAVVTFNRRDFLPLITFDNCSHVEGIERLRLLMEELETVYEIRVRRRGERLVAIIGRTYLRLEDMP